MAGLLTIDEARKQLAGLISGLDVRYDLGEGHPLLGRRMPDLDLVTANGPLRVFTLLHDARAVLLNLGEPGSIDLGAVGGSGAAGGRHVRRRVGAAGDRCSQRSCGRVDPARRACGVDGRRDSAGLEDALARWFGPPAAGG